MKILQFTLLFILLRATISIVISTSFGKLKGKEIGDSYVFKHVPFAKPPIGNLRFQKPETVEKWEDVRDATEYGPACMSNSTNTKSPQKWVDEDCLHVNLFTSEKCLETSDCAVVVYIHGGDMAYDSAVMFDENFLVKSFVENDVILVIPGFRLGIFSHFDVQDQKISPTNLGIYDILKALEFVKSEILFFGGSNKKVTIAGHSTGGTVTSMLSFSTEINQDLSLFQRSISLSGNNYFEPLELHFEKTQRFVEAAHCQAPRGESKKMTRNQQDLYSMNCLQNKSALELLRIQRTLEESGYSTYGSVVLREPLFQEVKPSEFMNSPKMIPMLVGCTQIEFDHEPELILLATILGFDNPEECEAKYRNDLKSGIYDGGNHSDKTQSIMIPAKLRTIKLLEKGIPVYLYEYSYLKHAKHTDDMYYVMGIHPFEEDENESHLETVYRNMFMNFAKYGYPGDGFEMADLENSRYFDMYWNETTGERPKMKDNFEKKVVDYWLKEMIEFDHKVTAEKMRNSIKSPDMRSSSVELASYGKYQPSYLVSSFMFALLIFFIGYCVGKFCVRKENNLYMRIDGRNFENLK